MTEYHWRGFRQSIFPRIGKGIKMRAKVQALEFSEGLKRYTNARQELQHDDIQGPKVIPGDKVIVEDYAGENTRFWEVCYLKGV